MVIGYEHTAVRKRLLRQVSQSARCQGSAELAGMAVAWRERTALPRLRLLSWLHEAPPASGRSVWYHMLNGCLLTRRALQHLLHRYFVLATHPCIVHGPPAEGGALSQKVYGRPASHQLWWLILYACCCATALTETMSPAIV